MLGTLRRCCFLGLMLLSLQACLIPLRQENPYPIPVYFKGERAGMPYRIIEIVELSDTRPHNANRGIRDELLEQYGQMPKGYNLTEKEILIYQLAEKARRLGADALVEVEYTLFVNKQYYGYKISGYAVKVAN
ncbi:uncharacterized protein YbjQ (UPF0145 family) [Thermonema lapsum]|uniref:Uncharacterized protein YbjQ (UPF0145 family) n=1 Tax=Thermonema lapsum TaxID=28195 RepID=A0A846MNH7_9BACT|nr:hypothetical protein [Thermonema lapsum]NIK72962.1 uncharacterized protein YbjQ (UPF0145 family) [Thermonema lapsum]